MMGSNASLDIESVTSMNWGIAASGMVAASSSLISRVAITPRVPHEARSITCSP